MSPASTIFRPRTRLAEHEVGSHHPSVGQRHRVAPLQRAALGPGRNLQRVRGFDVEPTRPWLDDRVADRREAMVRCEGFGSSTPRATTSPASASRARTRRTTCRRSAAATRRVREARRAEDLDGTRPRSAKVFSIPGSLVVIGVVVREEDLAQVDQPDRRAQQLALFLAAVEQQAVAPATHEDRARRAVRGRHRAGSAEEDEIEVHAGRVRSPRAEDDVRELLRREVNVEEYDAIRDLWKRHSIAEDERDLLGTDLDVPHT